MNLILMVKHWKSCNKKKAKRSFFVNLLWNEKSFLCVWFSTNITANNLIRSSLYIDRKREDIMINTSVQRLNNRELQKKKRSYVPFSLISPSYKTSFWSYYIPRIARSNVFVHNKLLPLKCLLYVYSLLKQPLEWLIQREIHVCVLTLSNLFQIIRILKLKKKAFNMFLTF